MDAFVSAFQTARGRLEKDDDIKRKVVRFSLNLMHDFLKNLSSSLLPFENSAEGAWRTKGALTETDILSEAQIQTISDLNSLRFNQKSSPTRKRKRKDKVPHKVIMTDNDNNSFVQKIE